MIKIKTPLIVLCFVVMGFGHQAYGQNTLFSSLDDFLHVSESFEKMVSFFNRTDDSINKAKVKNMTTELYGEISELILVKDSLVSVLETDSMDDSKFGTYIDKLQNQLTDITTTLRKYDNLINQSGVEATKLEFALRQEFLKKANTLRNAKASIGNTSSDEQAKKQLITYFKTCIQILKGTLVTLENFKP